MDPTYRADLRELNELNYARFDAKLEQRLAELHAKLDSKIDRVTAELRAEMRAAFAEQRADLLRWMFVYWGSSVVTTIGLVLLVLRAVT